MQRGWLLNLRAQRLGVIQWIVAALLLPSFLGLLSAGQTTPAAALARDLGQSICSIWPQGAPENGGPVQSSDHGCSLCIVGCATCSAAPATSRLTALLFPPASPVFVVSERDTLRSLHFTFDGASPRGPPALS